MNKKTTRYACLLAISRVSSILINTLNDRIVSVYMSDSYLCVKFHGLLTNDDVSKFNYCVGSIFSDFEIRERPTWVIKCENKQKDLDFTKSDSEIVLSIPSVTDYI